LSYTRIKALIDYTHPSKKCQQQRLRSLCLPAYRPLHK